MRSRRARSDSVFADVIKDAVPIFSRIEVRNFRGINQLTVTDLAPISIFTGKNGSGKTTILEAAWLLAGLNSAGLVEAIARARGIPISPGSDLIFSSIFRNLDKSASAELRAWVGRGKGALERSIEIRRLGLTSTKFSLLRSAEGVSILEGVELHGRVNGREYVGQIAFARVSSTESGEAIPLGMPIPESIGLVATPFHEHMDFIHAAFLRPGWRSPQRIHDILIRAKRERTDAVVIEVLKALVPELRDIQPYAEGGMPIIHVDLGEGPLMPVPLLGAGFANLVDIAIWVGAGPAKLVLIDEIEDGLHYTVLPNLARAIVQLHRRKGLQIMITTHSKDVVSAFAEAAVSVPAEVAFFNLMQSGNQSEAVRYSGEEARDLLEINSDVR